MIQLRVVMLTGLAVGTTAYTIHPDRLVQIKETIAAGATWEVGANVRFGSSPPGSFKNLLGTFKNNTAKVIHQAVERGEMTRFLYDPLLAIPASFDSATNWPHCAETINDIRDQSNCGCCWAFAGAEAGSDRMCIATKGRLLLPLSAQDVCFNSNVAGCQGGQIDTPWTFLNHHGAVSGGQYNDTGLFGGTNFLFTIMLVCTIVLILFIVL